MIRQFDTRQEMMKQFVKPGMKICELGVFMGEFAQFLYTLEPSELVLIDPFSDWCSSGNVDGNNIITTYLPQVYEYMRADFAKNLGIKLERGLSWDVLETFPDQYFDVIYIDSSHSYEGTKKELEVSQRKIKKGGIISGHDFAINKAKCQHNYEFGVRQAVQEFCTANNWELIAIATDGCISFAIQEVGKGGVFGSA